jgi:hypothetical protein
MNQLFKALALILICLQTSANSMHSIITQVIYHISHPLDFIKDNKSNDYWFAYSVPSEVNTYSSCCWNQELAHDSQQQSCDLNQQINGFSNNDKDLITKTNNIFVHVKNQNISQLFPVGEHCTIKAEGIHIAWLEDIDEIKSLEFLKSLALQGNHEIAANSLFAMALHQHKQASEELYEIAMLEKNEISNNAVFWLGETRNDGLNQLSKLYHTLPNGEVKQHINFALTQLDDNKGVNLLEEIAINDQDKQQRSDALFWLAEVDPTKTKQIIFNQLNSDSEKYDNEQSIFTLSRLDDGKGEESLFEILMGDYSDEIKRKSIFWLSQSDNENTIERLNKLINPL